jgi:histone-lysine N-methyltransferase SETMAR
MVNIKVEQRINIKFLVKLKKSPTECFEMLKEVFGDNYMSCARVFEWHRRFSEGREEVEEDERPGRFVSSRTDKNIQKINEIVQKDRRLGIRMIADMVNINKETVRQILHDNLNMTKVCAKLVPKNLFQEQKDNRKNICCDVMERLKAEPDLLTHVITCDETWIFQYNPETKRQSMHWKTPTSPRMKKARMRKSKLKAMLIVFFDIGGIIMTEWVPEGQTVNQTYYKEVLIKLRERVRKKRPDLWKNDAWILHQDNAPAHNALSVKQFLADKRIPVLEHPPYSPDLAPCDFYLFPKVKSALKGTHFQSVEEVKAKTAELLNRVTADDLQHCFEQWKARMQRCIDRGGEYIEGDKSQL